MKNQFLTNRILFLVSETFPFNAGGGKNTYNFAKYCYRLNQNILLLIVIRKRFFLPSCIYECPTKIITYWGNNKLVKMASLLWIVPLYFYYIHKHDIIFITGRPLAYEIIILFGYWLKKKVIFRSTMLHHDDIKSIANSFNILKNLRTKILNTITCYYALTPAFSAAFENLYHSRKKILESPQGVDTSVFYPITGDEKKLLRNKLQLNENIFIIISVGYLIHRKGFKEIFETLSLCDLPFMLIVVGNYSVPPNHYMYKQLDEMTQLYTLGNKLLANKIIFTGSITYVNEYLQASDVFLLNSLNEGLPNALLEAMACGIPCVIRNIEGVTDYIAKNNHNALVYSNPNDMLKHIKNLYTNENLRNKLIINSLSTILLHCTFDQIIQKLTNKLHEVN